jgi:hypothetical protein
MEMEFWFYDDVVGALGVKLTPMYKINKEQR